MTVHTEIWVETDDKKHFFHTGQDWKELSEEDADIARRLMEDEAVSGSEIEGLYERNPWIEDAIFGVKQAKSMSGVEISTVDLIVQLD